MKTKEEIRLRNKLWKINNKEKVKLTNKLYREKNKDKIIEYEKRRRNNPLVKEKIRKNVLRHYYKNREEKLLEMKRWRDNNKEWFNNWRRNNQERISSYQVEWQNRCPQNIMIHRLRSRLNTIFKNYIKTGNISLSRKYGIDYKKIIEHLKPFPDNIKEYHIDHIIPLSSFDLTNKDEVAKAFAPENHQWLLKKDNLSKHNKIL